MSNFIIEHGLIVIFRGVELEKIPAVAQALYDGGARIVEVAFNPSDKDTVAKTTAIIKKIYETMGDKLMVGAGTVISTEFVDAAAQAGAKFIFSPNTDTEVIKRTKELGLVSIPGAFTPSEVMTAYNTGADIIKMFPITKDDIGYLINITRPLSHVPFICVGGTNPDTIEDFIKAGAKGVGTGISILKPELINNDDYAEITNLTKLHLDKIKEARLSLE
ncbi:MAG: bifunctional 4-hydroxy-2-oxoglutarate aldolase/2-dehydro-3-deoxy-phosphogluconate aldolase [Clostridiales bacterium]|nr:bifunctional 4-hydroxy-2-oxoglutarate aldolase/2-dehydro-3-deoxy-phosphogluconate aldolase [Clostridiales bacterium]